MNVVFKVKNQLFLNLWQKSQNLIQKQEKSFSFFLFPTSAKRYFLRIGKSLFLFALSFLFVAIASTYTPATLKPTEILWDTYGVPHLYAQNAQDLFYGFGWAQMHSHGDLILRLYGQARGKAAEYWGEDYLASDRWVRTMGVSDRAQKWYEAQSPTFRRYLDAFVAGANAYVREYGDRIDREVKAVLPIEAVDVLAHIQRVLLFSFVVDPDRVASLTEIEEISHHSPFSSELGSNAWAIAPSRSVSGNALLLANPHLPWSDFFLWYEAHLNAPGVNTYGAALVGVPVLNIAFNDRLGWTHTVNTYDGWDAYELTLAKEGYQFDNRVQKFQTETQILKVREGENLRQKSFTVRHSRHGPVVMEKEGKAIALRVAGLDCSGILEQWWEMGRSQNLAQFETALKRLQLPMFTVIYADRDGHILHLFNGQVPVRTEGDFNFWSGLIPGNTSNLLWTKMHPYRDLPRVLDPPSGWLQNANDPPWTTTFPTAIDPDDYPAYLAPRGPMEFRPQHAAQMLASDQQISFEEAIAYKHSTQMELAKRLLDDLIGAVEKQGNPLARQGIEVLKNWDYRADADSRGAVLFAFWADEIGFSNLFATPWDEKAPLTTPDGLADPTRAVAALEAAATRVQKAYRALDVSWGEVFRLRSHGLDLPASGGSSDLGIFRHFTFVPSEDGHYQAVGGDSYIAAIEFSDPVRAKVLNSYGNATQAGVSPNDEQLKLASRQELRPVWRSRQEIEAHLSWRKELRSR